MDATANDVPASFEVRGFPTLYWAPKDAKDTPVRYEVRIIKYFGALFADILVFYREDEKLMIL